MSGMRSAFYTLVLGAGLACADSPTPFELPDSAYQPVTSLAADRVMAGTYVYESTMWTDGLVSSPQARESLFQCWRLESPETRLSRAGPGRTRVVRIPVRMWVAVDQPLVVKHDYGVIPDRREMVLVSFEPAMP
jgi:hypothetical protein